MTEPPSSPGTLFFNGEPMPKWSHGWHWLPRLERCYETMDAWDELVGPAHLWQLICRIDHVGTVESEDPAVFRICCLALLGFIVREREAIVVEMAADSAIDEGEPGPIVDGIRDGLVAMNQRVVADQIAFWTSGDEIDREILLDAMRRTRLPRTDPGWFEPPHLRSWRSQTGDRVATLEEEIAALTANKPVQGHGLGGIRGLAKDPDQGGPAGET